MPEIFGTTLFRQHGKVARFCPCSVETVQQLNRELIAPRLLPLLNRTFFRYVKLDLERVCPFWADDQGMCALRNCAVETCSEDEERRLESCGQGALGSVGQASLATLGEAAPAWDLAASSWTNEGELQSSGGGEWIDLVDNPEQYTGYAGDAGAWRVWHELHAHNVFHTPGCCGLEEAPADLARMPVEQRTFYRAFSGLHASISSHIAANYLLDRRTGAWGLELDEYDRRIGSHPERLHNLHFAFLLVLRAVELASPTLSARFAYSTGNSREDAATARAVRELLSSQPEWPLTFDEQRAFRGVRCPSTLHVPSVAAAADDATCGADADTLSDLSGMLSEYRSRLHNVSRLMDCVGCGRCRLWGKVQVIGLGTALRILYAPDRQAVLDSLQRAQVVTLFNLLGRLSHSVEVARVAVPLLGGAHATCSPRGCAATEYAVELEDEQDEQQVEPQFMDPFAW